MKISFYEKCLSISLLYHVNSHSPKVHFHGGNADIFPLCSQIMFLVKNRVQSELHFEENLSSVLIFHKFYIYRTNLSRHRYHYFVYFLDKADLRVILFHCCYKMYLIVFEGSDDGVQIYTEILA
jgi:hypothetical protein